MNKVLLGGAAALAILTASTGAQAQSISDTIGAGLIGLQGTFANGNWVNESLNTGAINGGVIMSGLGTIDTVTAIDLGGISVDAEAAAALALALGLDLEGLLDLVAEGGLGAALGLAAQLGVDIDLGTVFNDTQIGGSITALRDINTLAAGAVNTGDIGSIAASVSGASSASSFNQVTGAVSFASQAASSAANTTNTAASAAASNISLEIDPSATVASAVSTQFAASGPLADVYASNRAFNNAGINGAVVGLANDINLAGISTTVVGAVNTGTISMGFDGSAFADIE